MSKTSIIRAITALAFLLAVTVCAFGQNRGSVTGVIGGTTTPGVIVLLTNQVTSKAARVRVRSDGRYSARLPAGAYRISVSPPYIAKFDRAQNYGEHALIRDGSLENVVVSEGRETKIDFTAEKLEE